MTTLAEIESIFKSKGTFNLTVQPESASRKSSLTKSAISNGDLGEYTINSI